MFDDKNNHLNSLGRGIISIVFHIRLVDFEIEVSSAALLFDISKLFEQSG